MQRHASIFMTSAILCRTMMIFITQMIGLCQSRFSEIWSKIGIMRVKKRRDNDTVLLSMSSSVWLVFVDAVFVAEPSFPIDILFRQSKLIFQTHHPAGNSIGRWRSICLKIQCAKFLLQNSRCSVNPFEPGIVLNLFYLSLIILWKTFVAVLHDKFLSLGLCVSLVQIHIFLFSIGYP